MNLCSRCANVIDAQLILHVYCTFICKEGSRRIGLDALIQVQPSDGEGYIVLHTTFVADLIIKITWHAQTINLNRLVHNMTLVPA